MNDDIFPLVEKEFAGQVMGDEVYELAHQYIGQLLWGVCMQRESVSLHHLFLEVVILGKWL